MSKDEASDRARALGLILDAARQAIIGALTDILTGLWTEAWSVGERSSRALTRGAALAGSYLRDFLFAAKTRVASIADTLSNRLAVVLGQPGTVTVSDMVAALDSAGLWISWSELARAQWAAAVAVYREQAVMYASWQTEHDARVCPACARNEAEGALLLGEAYPSGNAWPPAHPRCRCALMPVEVAVAA